MESIASGDQKAFFEPAVKDYHDLSLENLLHMQTVRPSRVPKYLRTSKFFQGLSVADDDKFSIPSNYMKLDIKVATLTDMTAMLATIRFWGSDVFPQAMFDFAAHQPYFILKPILEPYNADLPFIVTVCSIASSVANSRVRLEKAMECGMIEVVKYFHKNEIPFSATAIAMAAGKGALDCLEYALAFKNASYFGSRNNVFTEAVSNGRMDSILFLQQKGFRLLYPVSPNGENGADYISLVRIAASSGQLEVLKYLYSQGASKSYAAAAAADAGHMECLDYALKFGGPLRGESWYAGGSGTLAQRLARSNQLKLFPEALSRDSKIDTQTALIIARSGNVECLKLCVEYGARPTIKFIAAVVQKGHLACLEYLHSVFVKKAEVCL